MEQPILDILDVTSLDKINNKAYVVCVMLRDFEYQILQNVSENRDGTYAYPIAEVISSTRGSRISLGAIHTGLSRLEEKGFVKSKVMRPPKNPSGRSRRYYKITGKGLKAQRGRERFVLKIYGSALAGRLPV